MARSVKGNIKRAKGPDNKYLPETKPPKAKPPKAKPPKAEPPKVKEFSPDKQWVRKCLNCRQEVTLDRPNFICDRCKRSDLFRAGC